MENIDIMIILAQVVNFLILFLVFKKFISDPMHKVIESRRGLLEKLSSADEEYALILEKAKSEQSDILIQARKDAEKLMRDMEELSKLKGIDIVAHAEKRAKSIVAGGKREIEKEKIYMMGEMKEKILNLTLKLNEKILDAKEGSNKVFLKKELDLLT